MNHKRFTVNKRIWDVTPVFKEQRPRRYAGHLVGSLRALRPICCFKALPSPVQNSEPPSCWQICCEVFCVCENADFMSDRPGTTRKAIDQSSYKATLILHFNVGAGKLHFTKMSCADPRRQASSTLATM